MSIFFLYLATIITVASVMPYVRDILRGKSKPNITSWITWTLITAVATIAEFANSEYITAIFTSSAVIATGTIIILGLRYGCAKYSFFDVVCQLGVLVGFYLWWLFDSPALAVVAMVTIDLLGALPTVRHSWIAPSEETWLTYAFSGLGGVFAVLALTSYNITSLSYPIYLVFINTLLATIIYTKKN